MRSSQKNLCDYPKEGRWKSRVKLSSREPNVSSGPMAIISQAGTLLSGAGGEGVKFSKLKICVDFNIQEYEPQAQKPAAYYSGFFLYCG